MLPVIATEALAEQAEGKQSLAVMTESIQDTNPRIHPWRNKKPVSDKGAPEFIREVNASI